MTIHDYLLKHCVDNGMFPEQAAAVIKTVETGENLYSMRERWLDQIEDYSAPFLAVLIVMINCAAVAWIDANLPKAWFRPLFDPPAVSKGTQ